LRSLYIARPIDRAGGADVTATIAGVVAVLKREVLAHSAVLTFDPGSAFTVGSQREVSPELQDINNKAIHASDSMLVFVPQGIQTWGVPAEVESATQRGMNVAIVHDGPTTWAMPSGRNVRYFMVGLDGEGWLDAAVKALDWLSSVQLPRFTTNNRNGNERTQISFAPIEGKDPKSLNLPTRAYSDDAGLDLYAAEGLWVGVGEFKDIPTHLRTQLPQWAWGFLVGRSSTLRKRKLLVNPGIIDTGYRGELYIGVQNLGDKPVRIEAGERLAQFIVMGNATRRVTPVMSDDLEPHARGHNGFGSSGV
jgi:dUTP pyrophosphatase